MLLVIAICPLCARHWWEPNRHKLIASAVLGHLAGVPFVWTFRLLPHWGLMLAVLLGTFFAYDSVMFAREPLAAILRDRARREPLRVHGGLNGAWLAGVVLAVAFLRAPWRELAI